MALPSPETTPPGDDDSFTPSEDRLLSFLRKKVAGEALPAAAAAHFHDTDIYTADPALLTTLFDPAPARKGESGSWFFFTRVRPKSSSDSRKSRQVAGGVGTWHSERAPRRVLDGEGNCSGQSQYFSYKLKTGKNCSERTEWYMVEFSQDQEADHGRVHGGEPQLVLCKIYKAHTHSRSGSGSASRSSCSASARKRKAVDDASAPGKASAPVKAKRRLFVDSPAPASAVSLQEQVTSKGWIAGDAATWQGNLGDTLDRAALTSTSKADGEAATSQGEIGDTLDWIASMSKADSEAATSQGKISAIPDWFPLMSKADDEAATSQGKMSGISDWFPLMSKGGNEVATSTSQGKSVDTSNCTALMSTADGEAATPQGRMSGISDWFQLMSKGDDEVATSTSQGKSVDTSSCTALMSTADGEAPTSQLKLGDTSDFSRFWPEPEATFDRGYSVTGGALPVLENYTRVGDTSDFSRFWPEPEATFDRGYSMTGGALPTLKNCSGGALPALKNCSRATVRNVGDLFCRPDAGSSALRTSDHTTTAFVRGMPSAPVLPQGEASWWSAGPAPAATAFGASDHVEASWWSGLGGNGVWSY